MLLFFSVPTVRPSFPYCTSGSMAKFPLIAFVGFGRWKPNKPHPAMDSYVDRLQNQSYIYFKYLLTSEDTFPLPLAFPSLFLLHFFLPYITMCCILDSITGQHLLASDSSHPLSPNTKHLWYSRWRLLDEQEGMLSSPWAEAEKRERTEHRGVWLCWSQATHFLLLEDV